MVKLDLNEFTPTDAEVERAKQVIQAANPKESKSKMAAMVQYVKNSGAPEEAKDKILNSRGDERQAYLRKYVAYTVAKGSGRLTSTASHSTEKADRVSVFYWNFFQMKKKVGEPTAAAWSKTLDWQKDPITNLDGEDHRQYIVPVKWFESATRDSERLDLGGERKSEKEDFR